MVDAGESSAWICEALDESDNDGVGTDAEYDRDIGGRPFCCDGAVRGSRIDEVDFLLFELLECFVRLSGIAFPISDRENKFFSFVKSLLFEANAKSIDDLVPRFSRNEDTDSVDVWLLRVRGEAKRKD